MSTPTRVIQVTLAEALAKRPPPDNLAAPILRCGDMELEFYAPVERDPQTPHSRDELYVIASGTGWFHWGEQRQAFKAGAVLFVPAGRNHHFSDFSPDFAAWVMFFGPEGGNAMLTVE